MQMSEALGIKEQSIAISDDLFAVCLVSFLGLGITATVFQVLAAYDLFAWIVAHAE